VSIAIAALRLWSSPSTYDESLS